MTQGNGLASFGEPFAATGERGDAPASSRAPEGQAHGQPDGLALTVQQLIAVAQQQQARLDALERAVPAALEFQRRMAALQLAVQAKGSADSLLSSDKMVAAAARFLSFLGDGIGRVDP